MHKKVQKFHRDAADEKVYGGMDARTSYDNRSLFRFNLAKLICLDKSFGNHGIAIMAAISK